jgi:O-acetylserine/cysteine efflux transporter
VIQPRVLTGRDPAAVTAVQFAAGALVAVPVAMLTDGIPHGPAHSGPVLAVAALSIAGTTLPFPLFAFGQARVPPELAGVFVNLEPVIGAAAGWVAFGDAVTLGQIAGAVAVVAGIAVSALPPSKRRRPESPVAVGPVTDGVRDPRGRTVVGAPTLEGAPG